MKRFALLVLAALLLAVCFRSHLLRAEAPGKVAVSALEQPIDKFQHQVDSWKNEARQEIVLVIALIVFGPFIALFQKSNSSWAKTATVALGIASSILTGVNSQAFSADYRGLKEAASEGEAIIAQLEGMVAILNDPHTTEENRKTTEGLYFKELAEFPAVISRLAGKGDAETKKPKPPGILLVSIVYAQSTAPQPAWVSDLPPDNGYSFYSRGEGIDTSLASAKTKSLSDAYNNALQKLKPMAPKAADPDILALVKAAAVVQDSTFSSNSNATGYTYYTLLRMSREITIGLKALPTAPVLPLMTYKARNWRPSDLSTAGSIGLVALDHNGGVSRLETDGKESDIDTLFRVPRSYQASVVTASADAIFVGANSVVGCTVFRYALADKAISQKLLGAHQHCAGIATDGKAIYLSMPDQREIKHWDSWDAASAKNWSIGGVEQDQPASMVFDPIGHRIIVAGSSGKAYAISVGDGKGQVIASNLGAVTSIAVSTLHILFGTGNKVLFVARSDNRAENPPADLRLTGGHVVGVAVDASGNLWFADSDRQLVEGPIPLS